MTDLAVFDFGGAKVRTAGSADAPLFCAADVCMVLGYERSDSALRRLDPEEQELVLVESGPGRKHATFVTESGLFSLILGSQKPEARAFKKWVTGEVLPAIRKRGYYNALEEQQRKTTEQLLAACFPLAPAKAKPLFSDLITALLKMRGEQHVGTPPWAPVLAQLVYDWSIPIDGQQPKRRALNSKRSAAKPDHSMFSDELRSHVMDVARIGIAMARNATNWNAWRAMMDTAIREAPLQLSLLVPVRALPSRSGKA